MGQAKIIHKRVTYMNVFFNSFERDKKNIERYFYDFSSSDIFTPVL